MKCKRLLCMLIAVPLACGAAFASKFTFTTKDGDVTFDVPNDFDSLVNDYKDQIQDAITEGGVSKTDLEKARTEIENAIGTSASPKTGAADFSGIYSGVNDGLGVFAKTLAGSIPSAQTGQNQWAQAWIGYLVPKFNMGAGINASVAMVPITGLKSLAKDLDLDDVLNALPTASLPLPAITADIRLGGVILPFDVGFTIMKLDTSKIDALSDLIGTGFSFDYLTIGGDIRYAIIKSMPLGFRVSANVGYYYTKLALGYTNSSGDMINGASLGFSTSTFTVGAQASAKLLRFIVPYAGLRLTVSRGTLDWSLTPNWSGLLGTSGDITDAVKYFLPKTLSDTVSSDLTWRPQIYAGIGLDLFVVDITAGVGYTFISNVLSGSLSVRIAWN